ncbi:MAG: hypothetical protein HQ575_06150 [Candidatus Omnitrophica bacterium]|nr:hypothetical protein [Candidatus Omnitrophota bacterium]
MRSRLSVIILIFAIIFVTGCGYTTGSLLPSHLKGIHVENFKNKIDISNEPSDKGEYAIYRPGVENDITQAVIDQFLFDGNLMIVDEADADLILACSLIDYYKQPLRYDKFNNVEEYRIIITVDMLLKDMVKDVVMWEEKGFVGYYAYRITGPFASDEETARVDAINDLSQKIVEKVVQGW